MKRSRVVTAASKPSTVERSENEIILKWLVIETVKYGNLKSEAVLSNIVVVTLTVVRGRGCGFLPRHCS